MFGCSKKNQANTKEELRREKKTWVIKTSKKWTEMKTKSPWMKWACDFGVDATYILFVFSFYHFYSLQATPQELPDIYANLVNSAFV